MKSYMNDRGEVDYFAMSQDHSKAVLANIEASMKPKPKKPTNKPQAHYKGSWAEQQSRKTSGKDCNCGAQNGPNHRPHTSDCSVYK